MPKSFDFRLVYGTNAGWLEQLGPKGPWIVERLIGMREFPQAMDTDDKASMLENCVRRACQRADGELDVDCTIMCARRLEHGAAMGLILMYL